MEDQITIILGDAFDVDIKDKYDFSIFSSFHSPKMHLTLCIVIVCLFPLVDYELLKN